MSTHKLESNEQRGFESNAGQQTIKAIIVADTNKASYQQSVAETTTPNDNHRTYMSTHNQVK
jgi:hypothetical protein